MLGEDFFLLIFDTRKRFLPDTKVHIFQPAVIMDFLKLKKPQPNSKNNSSEGFASILFCLEAGSILPVIQGRSLSGFPLKTIMIRTKSAFIC